jgi:hypothetical protein
MSAHWLMGEREDGVLHIYVCCGRCGARLLLPDDVDPRDLLRVHEKTEYLDHLQAPAAF